MDTKEADERLVNSARNYLYDGYPFRSGEGLRAVAESASPHTLKAVIEMVSLATQRRSACRVPDVAEQIFEILSEVREERGLGRGVLQRHSPVTLSGQPPGAN